MAESRPFAVITGASSGIGAVFARKLAAQGYDLLLIARRKERLDQLANELAERHGVRPEVFVADLANDNDLKSVEDRIVAEQKLELLVNNAGFGIVGRFVEVDPGGQDRMHRLHVIATLRLTSAVLPGMVARRKGGVINVSSVAGFMQSPGNVSYCATKTWINSFTEGLYLELKSAGSPVKMQALCPGFTYSEFHEKAGMDRSKISARLWMSAEDVVDASLRGFAAGKLFVVPGWRYRLVVFVMGRLPRFVKHGLTTRYARQSGKLEERSAT